MKQSFLFILLFCSCLVNAQEFSFPRFPAKGKSLEEFIQPNWFLKDSTAGDLNGDKLSDLAFVLEYQDTVLEKRPDGKINKGSPRILAVLLKNAGTGEYHLFCKTIRL